MNRDPYRDGQIHVLAVQCDTCVFRPGNRMNLDRGRLADLVRSNIDAQSALTCHDTLYRDDVDKALCRGFWDRYRHRVQALQIADRLRQFLAFDPVPPPRDGGPA